MEKRNLIVFEGIDGSGKSTQFNMLRERFDRESRDFRRLRYPRYDKPSSALIKMYLNGELGDNPGMINAYAASSFYAVDRYASYMQDWRKYYESGGLILTDRYTTSNAIHQGAKLSGTEQNDFLTWLYNYEFDLLGLPRPDLVVYLDISADVAERRLRNRKRKPGISRDIHEEDVEYLKKCSLLGKYAADFYNWHSVDCVKDGKELNESELHEAVYDIVLNHLTQK